MLTKKIQSILENTKTSDMLFKATYITLGILMYSEKILAAQTPSTGNPELDGPAWKIAHLAQSVIFWAAMFYSFRCLLEWAVKRDRESSKGVWIGFLICAIDYLIPWGFNYIRYIFS